MSDDVRFSVDGLRVEAAVRRIIEAYAQADVDTSRQVYTEGDLTFARDLQTTEITYHRKIVFSAQPVWAAGGTTMIDQGEWIEEVERIDQSIAISKEKGGKM